MRRLLDAMRLSLIQLRRWPTAHQPVGVRIRFSYWFKLGLLGAIQNIGSLGALPFTPYLCDGLGRKKTIFIGAIIVVAGAIIQTAAQSVEMFIGSRFMRM